jgi:DNA-binding CsgD family transcriptional regulator
MRREYQGVRVGDEPYMRRDAAMTFEEIARETGMSKQLVWFHYRNAIRKLRRNRRIREIRELARMRECNQ